MRLQLLLRAQAELARAARWYERKASLGDALIAEVDATLARVAASPRSFPKHPDDPASQRALVGRFPYAIVFVVEPDRVVVVAITHLSRRAGYWKAAPIQRARRRSR